MNVYKIPSTFFGEVAIFHYPAKRKTGRAVLVLKGLYGEHNPMEQSWDNQLADSLKDKHEVFLFSTGRRSASDKSDKREAFVGKTYENECVDTRRAFIFCRENILQSGFSWGAVAMSFGGTILMGCPDVLKAMQGVVMAGSGCGKSPSTTKPLVSTLPDTSELLNSVSEFSGSLYFLHGGKDMVVPIESQKKIYESATGCFSRGWVEFPNLDHELNDTASGTSHTAIWAEKFLEISFSR